MRLPDSDTHFQDIETYQQRQWQAGVDATQGRSVAVDIGAHVGSFTVRYAAVFDTVIAIEPVNTEYLFDNIAHLGNVIVQPVGCSNTRTTLYAHNPAPGNSGAWELHAQPQYEYDAPIRVIPLDDIELHACDLIKVDCQGHETQVVEGAQATIERFRPTLQLELPSEQLQKHLEGLDYYRAVTIGKDWIYTSR